jgi:HD-GYP domain-containing protein (c-di-GMP phosphodiesterase class II)
VRNFHLGSFPFIEMLRAVVEMHHEALDGSGYPRGLREAQIPIEARIVAVADVFDALSSRRRYKKPWSNARAFTELLALSPAKLDHDCVAALMARRSEVERIQRRFPEAGRAKGPRALRA